MKIKALLLSVVFTIGLAYILLGKYDEAIPYYKETIEHTPGYWRLYVDLAACYAALGMEEESKAQVQKILNAVPNFSVEKYAWRNSLMSSTNPVTLIFLS